MASEHPNAAIARRLWNAAARGDPDPLLELYAPDAVLRAYGDNPLSGEYKGGAGVVEYLIRAGEMVDDLRASLLDIYASDAGAVTRYRTKAARGAKRLDMVFLIAMRIEGGRVVETDVVATDQKRNDAFWAID